MRTQDGAPTIEESLIRSSPVQKRSFAILAGAWTLLIFVLCWIPAERLPDEEGAPGLFRIPHLDKFVHAAIFAGFGALWRLSGMTARNVLIFGAIAALASETGQLLPILHRDFGWDDAAFDLLGVVLGLMAAEWWNRRARHLSGETSS